jgi:hypothetical protein
MSNSHPTPQIIQPHPAEVGRLCRYTRHQWDVSILWNVNWRDIWLGSHRFAFVLLISITVGSFYQPFHFLPFAMVLIMRSILSGLLSSSHALPPLPRSWITIIPGHFRHAKWFLSCTICVRLISPFHQAVGSLPFPLVALGLSDSDCWRDSLSFTKIAAPSRGFELVSWGSTFHRSAYCSGQSLSFRSLLSRPFCVDFYRYFILPLRIGRPLWFFSPRLALPPTSCLWQSDVQTPIMPPFGLNRIRARSRRDHSNVPLFMLPHCQLSPFLCLQSSNFGTFPFGTPSF